MFSAGSKTSSTECSAAADGMEVDSLCRRGDRLAKRQVGRQLLVAPRGGTGGVGECTVVGRFFDLVRDHPVDAGGGDLENPAAFELENDFGSLEVGIIDFDDSAVGKYRQF
jgi:hypothetical protein